MTRYAFVLATALLAGCSSNPIAPVSDFDFVFEEIGQVRLGGTPDTTEVPIDYEPLDEDTSVLITQRIFLEDAWSAPQSGSVPATVSSVAEAAHAAFQGDVAAHLAGLAEEASADPAAFVAAADQAMEDDASPLAVFTASVLDVAQGHVALAQLLGLAAEAAGSTAARVIRGPVPSEAVLSAPITPGAASPGALSIRGATSCTDDARIQSQDQMGEIESERQAREAALERSLAKNLAAADSFEVQETRRLRTERRTRAARAEKFYVDVEDAITTLVEHGLVTQGSAGNLRLVNVTVVLSRSLRSVELFRASSAAAVAAAARARTAAREKYERERAELDASYDQAISELSTLESEAVQQCHDQGQTSG